MNPANESAVTGAETDEGTDEGTAHRVEATRSTSTETIASSYAPGLQSTPNLTTSVSASDVYPTNGQGTEWSAAVGRATTGKSGRVIERLMGDNDRLMREMKVQTSRCEEAVGRSKFLQEQVDALRAEKEQLGTMERANRATFNRRDRKIEQLTADLQAETARRKQAEREARNMALERDEAVETSRSKVAMAEERRQHVETQHDILSDSYLSQMDTYKRQLDAIQAKLSDYGEMLTRLDVTTEQGLAELDKINKSMVRMTKLFDNYKVETEAGINEMKETARQNARAALNLQSEMDSRLRELRWVVDLHRGSRNAA